MFRLIRQRILLRINAIRYRCRQTRVTTCITSPFIYFLIVKQNFIRTGFFFWAREAVQERRESGPLSQVIRPCPRMFIPFARRSNISQRKRNRARRIFNFFSGIILHAYRKEIFLCTVYRIGIVFLGNKQNIVLIIALQALSCRTILSYLQVIDKLVVFFNRHFIRRCPIRILGINRHLEFIRIVFNISTFNTRNKVTIHMDLFNRKLICTKISDNHTGHMFRIKAFHVRNIIYIDVQDSPIARCDNRLAIIDIRASVHLTTQIYFSLAGKFICKQHFQSCRTHISRIAQGEKFIRIKGFQFSILRMSCNHS